MSCLRHACLRARLDIAIASCLQFLVNFLAEAYIIVQEQ
jgi:hypothetical protein